MMIEIKKYEPIEQENSWDGGVSYKAKDCDNNRIVDLKIFKYQYFSPEKWRQITKKLLRLFALDHPSAQKILDLELVKEPYFVAFEYIPKKTLQQCDISSWQIHKKLKLITQISQIVANAHKLGIVHNNLSPSTIYLTEQDNIKIDFFYQESHTQEYIDDFHNLCSITSLQPTALLDTNSDIYSIGMIFSWLLSNSQRAFSNSPLSVESIQTVSLHLDLKTLHLFMKLINEAVNQKISLRPSAAQINIIAQKLLTTLNIPNEVRQNDKTLCDESKTVYDIDEFLRERETPEIPQIKSIGRFEILRKIGEGGMGVVYEAKDITDGSHVALKIILPQWAGNKEALHRFYKEARLLSEVKNLYVANMLEINQENQLHYLVMEFVPGVNIDEVLRDRSFLNEKEALFITSDIVRGLLAAHEKGVVHRDIKPSNILLAEKNSIEKINEQPEIYNMQNVFAKLSDFGLAKHVADGDSLDLTKSGAIIGTPKYMSPEQCKGEKLDGRSDIYSVGATLFHLVTGRAPFEAETPIGIISKHLHTAPPSPREYMPELSDNLCSIIKKCLEKEIHERYPNAELLLKDLENLLCGKPTQLEIHPRVPKEKTKNLLEFNFEWTLKATPKELWPFVTNTERVNKAIGLVAPKYFYKKDSTKGRILFARNASKAFPLEWQEHPYEWLHEKRMSILREYSYGLFKWMVSIVELNVEETGTRLTHKFIIAPRTFIARLLLNYQFKGPTYKKLSVVYNNIDLFCLNAKNKKKSLNAFEQENELPKENKILLQHLIKKSKTPEIDQEVAKALEEFLAKSSDQDVARIRPLALARRTGVDEKQMIHLCLNATKEGLLTLLWDIICPLCRIPSDLKGTLKELKTHGHCEACNINYELDFANSVELIFCIHKSVRESDLKIYCIGGPSHSPHVVSQVKLNPKERISLNVKLAEGAYILRSSQLANTCRLNISPEIYEKQQNIQISQWHKKEFLLNDQHQSLHLINDFEEQVVVRLEHSVSRQNVLTAAYVSSLPLFRKLFPQEVLSPEQLVSISNLILLAVDIRNTEIVYTGKNDNDAFQILYTYFQTLEQFIEECSGAVIKTTSEGIIATFNDSEKAIDAAIHVRSKLQKNDITKKLDIRIAVNKGTAMVATINNRLDYFGFTLKAMRYLLKTCKGNEIVMNRDIAQDVRVMKIIKKLSSSCKTYKVNILGVEDYLVKIQENGCT